MLVDDAMTIRRQASQRVQVGLEAVMTPEIAQDLINGGEAWTALRDGEPVACLGIRETFPGVQGVAWAILAEGVGSAHLAITRHARRRIAESPLVRIEAIVRTSIDAECVWARMAGLSPVALLRKFGALSEDHLLFERVR
ncbi:hypothetical protein [Sphingomonas sp. LaA6.9]|uniref:hypothetical protein n=1 Tax=Sphingomonas sp. LaA6.9 TaxID=2919914 RepID=UPI001F4F1C5C|nr:hypothetical protein [Sphingomonas sp. LaA6.9]MCJ8159859.1 hypothetical protein [Sphingomonas sp. LaA6.9]